LTAPALALRSNWPVVVNTPRMKTQPPQPTAIRRHPPAQLARMACPVGLGGIHGKEPEVLAVAVVAQRLAVSGAVAEAVGPTV
jgi:hypothetical protein